MNTTLARIIATVAVTGTTAIAAPGAAPNSPGRMQPDNMRFMLPGGPGSRHETGRGFGKANIAPPGREQLADAGASAEQIDALMALRHAAAMRNVDLRAAVEKAQLTLDVKMTGATDDESGVMDAVDALNLARGEVFKAEITTRLQMRQILGDVILSKLHEPMPGMRRRPSRQDGHDVPPPDKEDR